jgi:hypothetical protein
MKPLRILAAAAAILFMCDSALHAQPAPRKGAAERSGKGLAYPEPAVPGATGASPDYSDFTDWNERWDIYVNLLWRKTGSRRNYDRAYFDMEMANFMQSMPSRDRATLVAAGDDLSSLMVQIRANAVSLPYRDSASGCLLFLTRNGGRRDLAADDCRRR